MKTNINFHGSDIEKVANYFNIEESSIKNYSGNVNPLGLSKSLEKKLIANIHLVTNYPDPDYTKLKANIATYTGSETKHILLGNGSTELIAHYIDYIQPKKALIIGPTYSEYENKIKTLNAEVLYYPLNEETNFTIDIDELIKHCTNDINLLVLCNPNNPTASFIESEALYPLFDHCKSYGIYILIDETYMDFVDESSRVSALSLTKIYNNCIVLRGFSKFFAAPGLRLGYGITSDMNCHRSLEKQRHHWSINSLTAFAGKELMIDTDFIKTSKEFIHSERVRLMLNLNQIDSIKVFPANANFFFVKLLKDNKNSKGLFEFLIKQGMMVRNTSTFPFLHGEFFRFCILSKEDNDLLIDGIRSYMLS